jgi:hypothetical protein
MSRIEQNCDNCQTFDTQPRHHHMLDLANVASYCFQCATDLEIHDYSAILAQAEAAGVSVLDILQQE